MDEAAGRAVLDRIANPDPHEGQLPIRHHITAQIVAWIPERFARECRPVVRNGLVVGYMRVTPEGEWQYPHFRGAELYCWFSWKSGQESWPIFGDDGLFTGVCRL